VIHPLDPVPNSDSKIPQVCRMNRVLQLAGSTRSIHIQKEEFKKLIASIRTLAVCSAGGRDSARNLLKPGVQLAPESHRTISCGKTKDGCTIYHFCLYLPIRLVSYLFTFCLIDKKIPVGANHDKSSISTRMGPSSDQMIGHQESSTKNSVV
jgi:hypothetical protein